VPPPRIRPIPAPTPTRTVAIACPRGRFTSCAHHRFRRCRTSRSSSRPSSYSSSPTCCPRPRSQPRADRCSSTSVWVSRSCSWPFSVRAVEKDMVVLCHFGGSRVGKTPAFSRPSRTDAWCGCLSVWSCSGCASFPAGVLSPYMYLAVYYLCCLQMPRSSSCPSPATTRYARLFPSPPALRNLGSGRGERWGL
jgi:hypothetical protein